MYHFNIREVHKGYITLKILDHELKQVGAIAEFNNYIDMLNFICLLSGSGIELAREEVEDLLDFDTVEVA